MYSLLPFLVLFSDVFRVSVASPVSIIVPREDDPYRIPENLLEALHYDLELTLLDNVFETNKYRGVLDLSFTILQNTNFFKLHAEGINFTQVSLEDINDNVITLEDENLIIDPSTTLVTIKTVSILQAGTTYILHLAFDSELRTDATRGLYKSSYQTSTGEIKYLAATQFQTTYTRRSFPCFDEPLYKATFDISIVHPSYLNAKSNKLGTPEELPEFSGYTRTTFPRTPKMSTYLIAFVISEFTCTDGVDIEDGIPSGVCSQPETETIRDFAVDLGPKILWALQELTGVNFSESGIGKVHQAAIPGFGGAMENWGLVTYGERYLLWDVFESSNQDKQLAATTISHELGHFWFGDLVTCHWWSDAFLNEGFATYYEWFGAAKVLPDWELDKQFVIEEVHYALSVDATESSQPLSYPASTRTEVSARFGTITYSKGGSIIRMVSHFVGEDRYRLGITKYLETNKFQNTKPEDLWNAIQPYTNGLPTTLSNIMDNWINTPGFPLLKVSIDRGNVVVSQNRFLLSGTPNTSQKWYVPISYTLSDDSKKFANSQTRKWLLPTEDLIIIDVISAPNSWVILNNYQVGYYRVDYDNTLWQNILKALKEPGFNNIPDLNRGQLVDDLLNLAKGNIHSFIDFLEFISFLEKDESYFAWYQAFQGINYLLPKIGEAKLQNAVLEYLSKLISNFYNSVQLVESKNDNQIYSLKRTLAGIWGCRVGLDNCKNYTLAAFADYKLDKKPDKNLRFVVYCNGLRYSQDPTNDWNFLFGKYLEEASLSKASLVSANEQTTILSALGCTDTTQAKIFLQKAIDPFSGLAPSNLEAVFSAVYTNSFDGLDICLDFLIDNYKNIANLSGSYAVISTLISNLGTRFSRKDQLEKLGSLLETDLPAEATDLGKVVLENARSNVAWSEAFEKELVAYFELDVSDSNSNSLGDRQLSVVVPILCFSFFILFG